MVDAIAVGLLIFDILGGKGLRPCDVMLLDNQPDVILHLARLAEFLWPPISSDSTDMLLLNV